MDVRHFCRTIIKPIVGPDRWRGLYSGRRGGITAVIDMNGGNVIMGQMLGRHKNPATTLAFYKKRSLGTLAAGMKMLEGASKRTTDALEGFGTLRDGCADRDLRPPRWKAKQNEETEE